MLRGIFCSGDILAWGYFCRGLWLSSCAVLVVPIPALGVQFVSKIFEVHDLVLHMNWPIIAGEILPGDILVGDIMSGTL